MANQKEYDLLKNEMEKLADRYSIQQHKLKLAIEGLKMAKECGNSKEVSVQMDKILTEIQE